MRTKKIIPNLKNLVHMNKQLDLISKGELNVMCSINAKKYNKLTQSIMINRI